MRTAWICAAVGRNNIEHSSTACTALCTGIGDIGSTYGATGHDNTPPSYIVSAAATAGTLSIGGSDAESKKGGDNHEEYGGSDAPREQGGGRKRIDCLIALSGMTEQEQREMLVFLEGVELGRQMAAGAGPAA